MVNTPTRTCNYTDGRFKKTTIARNTDTTTHLQTYRTNTDTTAHLQTYRTNTDTTVHLQTYRTKQTGIKHCTNILLFVLYSLTTSRVTH